MDARVIPAVAPIAGWDDLIATFGSYDRVYLPWELADVRPLRETFEADAAQIASALFVIGPEGGFSAAEVERARCRRRACDLARHAHPAHRNRRARVLTAFAYARGEL